VYVLGKEISNMRQFYWDHNEESQYLENHQLGEDKRRLENEVNILKHKIKELTSQINQLEKNQRSLEYHAVIPFKNKISYLENIIAEQDRELTNLRANANELSKLRALATTSEESNISRNDTAQLADISKEKRIIVIGGHTNWRNNLGFDFPELQLIDGTTASFDFRTLETADYIIFYTYNMAHTVYEKAISYVRNKSIPYGYLPRITNPTLVAEQILNIILKEQ
jgi:seryl-tRNA synthetase